MATYWENSCSFGLRYVSWYKYLIVSLVFSHLGFWSGNLFLIAPFPDLCLLVPFYVYFVRNVSLVHKIFNLQSYSIFLGVLPPGPSMHFRQFVCFTHSHIISKWHPGSWG